MRKTVINSTTKVVTNIIILEEGSQWSPPDGEEIGPDGGNIGWVWNGTEYYNPNPPVEEQNVD